MSPVRRRRVPAGFSAKPLGWNSLLQLLLLTNHASLCQTTPYCQLAYAPLSVKYCAKSTDSYFRDMYGVRTRTDSEVS